jgi:hypothetical protein
MASVESLKEALSMLVVERQALRERHADRNELESNRLALVARQQQFSRALIDRWPHRNGRATMLIGTASYIKRHHLALLALFFALGGTAFAAGNALLPGNSVGTKQVINGSLQTSDLSKTARTALKGNRGPTGPAGAQGAQGPQGAMGAQGVPGAPGQSATKLFVAMDADGTLTKNSGATLATKAGTGVYRISFNTDITNCATWGRQDRTLVVFQGTTTSLRAAPGRPRSTSRSSMEVKPRRSAFLSRGLLLIAAASDRGRHESGGPRQDCASATAPIGGR